MKKLFPCLLLLSLAGAACRTEEQEPSIEQWKQEIVAAEEAFCALAQEEGIPTAFLTYAADDAVLMRNNRLIKGKAALRESYQNAVSASDNSSLTWKADFVDVASSGDLGYTYGTYVYTFTDSLGATQLDSGIFHTVWKRQPDGNWRFVWD